jgi:hypothetical protein
MRFSNSVTPATRSAVATITAITEPAFYPEVSMAGTPRWARGFVLERGEAGR